MALSEQARSRIREAASAFLTDALARLAEAHALPVDRPGSAWPDYATIWAVLGREVGDELAEVLHAEVPGLVDDLSRPSHRRSTEYPEALLRAVVALALVRRVEPTADGPLADRCIDELLVQVGSPDQTVRVVRLLSDVDASAVDSATVYGLRLRATRGREDLVVSSELPEAVPEANQSEVSWRTGGAVVVGEATGPGDQGMLTPELRVRMDRAGTALRLLTAGTIVETVEFSGQPTMVHVEAPMVMRLAHPTETYWRRPVRLVAEQLPGLEAIARMLERLAATKPLPPVVLAVGRFNRSHHPAIWQDVVVDLAVGLESALAGGSDRDDLTLALKSRAAHLLAQPADPSSRIFDDVGELYDFRSKVVHGRVVGEKQWDKVFSKRGLDQVFVRDRQEVVFDRWRDLLRRVILCRMMLGEDPPLWAWTGATAVDRTLVDPELRATWVDAITARANGRGIAAALEPAVALRNLLAERHHHG